MSNIGLHNKYRPTDLDGIIGHESVVTQLKGIISRGTFPSAILFTGGSGVGKTTIARAFVNSVNTEEQYNTNCQEINFGESRAIEDVRNLIQVSRLRPTPGAKRRFLLGDEAQQLLSNSPAANALLKPLEEPVSTTTFLLCSMEPDKFSSTTTGRAFIRRCVQIHLQPPTAADLRKQALRIIKGEKMKEFITSEVLDAVIQASNLSMSILANNLESLLNFHAGLSKKRELTPEDVESTLAMGSASDDALAARTLISIYARKYVSAHREILDVSDTFGFVNKCLWMNWFLLNQMVLKGERHPKVWGNSASWEMLKLAQTTFKNEGLTREQQITIVSDTQAALTSLKMGSGAFAVDEKMAMASMVWSLINSLKKKLQ